MNKLEFAKITDFVFANCSAGNGNLAGTVNFTRDGVVAIAGENVGTLGFGIASAITPTREVLVVVDELNQQMNYGHYWLAEGSDNQNWSLVCGFKTQYELSDPQQLTHLAAGIATGHHSISNVALEKMKNIEHRRYWLADVEAEPQALVLLDHLG